MKLLQITLRYSEIKLKNGTTGIVMIDSPEKEKKYEGKVKELQTQFKQPSWRENNEILRQSMVWDDYNGCRELDIYIYRQLALEKFLNGWDIVDDCGKPVPCNKENISRLEISIANALIEEFMARNIPTEEELKDLAYSAHKYYSGRLARNEMPPDTCVEIAIFDRFGWSPGDLENISLKKMREIFIVLEQQRVSRDAVDNLGSPTPERHNRIMEQKRIEAERKINPQPPRAKPVPAKPNPNSRK